MCLIPHSLQEPQGWISCLELQFLALIRKNHGFLPLRQTNDWGRIEIKNKEGFQGRGNLTGSSVNHDQVRKTLSFFMQSRIPSSDHFLHRPKIVIPLKGSNLESSVGSLIRLSRTKANHRSDHESSGNMRNVKAFDDCRGRIQSELLCKSLQTVESAILGPRPVSGKPPIPAYGFIERIAQVAQLGRLFKIHRLRSPQHLLPQFGKPAFGSTLEKGTSLFHANMIFFQGWFVVSGKDFSSCVIIQTITTISQPNGLGIGKKDSELLPHFGQGGAQHAGLGEWSVIVSSILLFVPAKPKLGQIVLQIHSNQEKLLIVRKVSVVTRLVLLD